MSLEKLSLASITALGRFIVFSVLSGIFSQLLVVTLALVIARFCEEIMYVSS